MAVVDLESKAIERLARRLIPHLVAAGIVTAEEKEPDNIERWAQAARLVGSQLGYPVRTTRRGTERQCAPSCTARWSREHRRSAGRDRGDHQDPREPRPQQAGVA